MLTVRHIMPLLAPPPAATAKPMFDPAVVIASAELQAARLGVCNACQFNLAGVCKQCCGGVPITNLINLTASRCGRHFWKA